MATITKPTAFGFSSITGGYQFAQGVATDPYTLKTRVDDFGGQRKTISVSTPPLATTDKTAWVTFVKALRGSVNTFDVDIADYFPGETGTVSFRMTGSPQWSFLQPDYIQLNFTAVEVV